MGKIAQESTLQQVLEAVSDTSIQMPFPLRVALGQVENTTAITKFGYNSAISTGTVPEDIWGQGDVWVAPTQARLHNIVSTDPNDANGGTGANRVLINGINSIYQQQSEIVTMNGTSNVPTVNTYLFIHRMLVLANATTPSTGGINIGTITATAQTDATVTCSIEIGYAQSQFALYQVPVGYTVFVFKVRARINNNTAASAAQVVMYAKPFNGVFNAKLNLGLNNSGSSFVQQDYEFPLIFTEKTIIKLTCVSVSNNNTSIEGSFDFYLIKNV